MKHCADCEHHEPMFHHCRFRETEPLDMRRWRIVCSAADEAGLRARLHPQYVMAERADEDGDRAVVDVTTGEVGRFAGKYVSNAGLWVCVEYLPVEA